LDDLIIGATEADSNGKLDTGKSYVIFGKTDTDAKDLPVSNLSPRSASAAPIIKSSKPSPFTSPALEVVNQTQVNLMLSSAKKTVQQLIYLLFPMAQGVLSLSARMRVIIVATQSPVQAMSMAMAWMI
jgi:hypothetical protein